MTRCAIEIFTKKLFGKNEIKTVLQRLDRLTQEEALAVTQTFGAVRGLVANMETVTEGALYLHNRSRISEYLFD
jgi:hypothetical protein